MTSAPDTTKSPTQPAPATVTRRKSRTCTREACESCREKKAKCNGANPCSRCASKGVQCRYETRLYQTKRSLKAELQDLRDDRRRLDAVITALATPAQSDRVLRKLWDGSTVEEIYETISGGADTSPKTPPPPPPPTAVAATPVAGNDEATEPETPTDRTRWPSASSSKPSMSASSPGSITSEQPAPALAQETFEYPYVGTGTCYGQPADMPIGNGPFGPCLDELAAGANHFGQPGYDMSPFASASFVPSPLHSSFDASMMSGGLGLNLATGGEFQQAYPVDDVGAAAAAATSPASLWACSSAAVLPVSGFLSVLPVESLPWWSWQFPAPTGPAHPVPSVAPSPMAPHPAPSGEPVHAGVASASVSDPTDDQEPSSRRRSSHDVPADASADNHHHQHQHDVVVDDDDDRRRAKTPPAFPPPHRERNRYESAHRWQRQKRQISDLERATSEAEARNRQLRRQHSQVLAEVLAVKDTLIEHAGCENPGISAWLRAQATNFVADGGGRGSPGAVASGSAPGSASWTSAPGGDRDGAVCI